MRLVLPLRHKQNWTLLFENFSGYPDGISLRAFSLLASVSTFVYDVGMNAGLYLYHGVASAPTGAVVVGFEPNQRLASLVRSNLSANGLTNVRVESLCCSDRDGWARFFITNTDHMSTLESGFLAASGRPILGNETIETVALDTYVRDRNLGMDLAKIDVEGHEEKVLAGAWQSIALWHPSLIVEITDMDRGGQLAERLFALKYRCFYCCGEELTTIENPGELVRLRREGDINYLFVWRDEHLKALGDLPSRTRLRRKRTAVE